MNFFPGIYQSKKVKKATSFCNPLTGSFYSNKDFLRNCKNVPRSISELDHIKQIKYEANNEESFQKSDKNSGKSTAYTSKQVRKRMQREMIAVHVTNKLAEPVKNSFNESAILKRKYKKASLIEKSQQIQRSSNNKSSLSTNSYKDEVQCSSYMSRQDKPTNMSNSLIHGSVNFNDIEILVLDLLIQQQDFLSKTIRINLQKYFRSFFKKQLTGHLTQQFLDKVEYYISELLQRQKIDQSIDQSQYPIEFFTINSRIIFMNKLLEFQAKKTLMNEENIRMMIKFYCVPSKQFRESCLRDIILMLTLQIYEKFNCSRENQYILLDQSGNQIQEILQIKFSTKKLFLTSKKSSTKNFNNYLVLLDEFYQQGKKLTFTENIKLNFRNKLAQGQYDDSHFNYSQNHQLHKLKRLVELENAQNMLKKKADTHRVGKFLPKQQSSNFTQYSFKKTDNQGFFQDNPNNSQYLNQFTEKSNLKDQNLWRLSQKRMSPQITIKKNLSPQKAISSLRIRSSLKNQKEIQKEKLQSLLKDHKKNGLNEETYKKILNEFRDLVTKNDIVDFKFNHHFKDRVLKQVLKSYFVYFKDKTDDQINKIMQSLKNINDLNKVNVNQENPSIQSIGKTQIQDTEQQNKNQKLDALQREKYIENSLTWQQFKNLKTIAGCSQPKEPLMNFVAKYFNFNEFGELSKQDLFKGIKFILQEKCDQASEEIIVDVIWSWFESNSIIENGFIRRMTLESWYEKYKIVYFMLVSLIFGSNHKTVLDLAYQVLA